MVEFWLKNDVEGYGLLLPVTPKGYEITFATEIETIRTTSVGDINVAGHESLKTMTVSSFFPYHDYEFARKSMTPMEYKEKIEEWREKRAPIRFLVLDGAVKKVNHWFYIESIKLSEDNETNKDLEYTITLREFRKLKKIILKPETNISATENERDTEKDTPNAKTYKVQSGDSLSRIARKMYGDASMWEAIYNANKSIIKNPNIIYVGQVLVIPVLSKSSKTSSSKNKNYKTSIVNSNPNNMNTLN